MNKERLHQLRLMLALIAVALLAYGSEVIPSTSEPGKIAAFAVGRSEEFERWLMFSDWFNNLDRTYELKESSQDIENLWEKLQPLFHQGKYKIEINYVPDLSAPARHSFFFPQYEELSSAGEPRYEIFIHVDQNIPYEKELLVLGKRINSPLVILEFSFQLDPDHEASFEELEELNLPQSFVFYAQLDSFDAQALIDQNTENPQLSRHQLDDIIERIVRSADFSLEVMIDGNPTFDVSEVRP